MAAPIIISKVVKAATVLLTDKRSYTAIASVVGAILVPFILGFILVINIASAGAQHNKSAVNYCFRGGNSAFLPEDYRGYIKTMQECFVGLDVELSILSPMCEDGELDEIMIKSFYYANYFGKEHLTMEQMWYQKFAECFVRFEERTRMRVDEDGTEWEETYTAAIPIKNMMEVCRKLEREMNGSITDEVKGNALNVYSQVTYGNSYLLESDRTDEWEGWEQRTYQEFYDVPYGENGNRAVSAALQRLGHPYSQKLRGKGNYTDCSYLTMWSYRQTGIHIPGTAAEQARYCVDNKRTIAKENLQPGDLVFWSHKPNGRYLNITHVGIYAGEGKVIDASSSKGMVVYRNLFDADKQVLYGRP
ncbi:MAG: C40 family peptidase [Brevinema sp.]